MAETSKESEKKTADDMAFRNETVNKINALTNENATIKEMMGKRQRVATRAARSSMASKIQGLETLKNTLGTQFKSRSAND